MAQVTDTIENVETGKASKKGEFTALINEVEEIGGYVSSKKVADIFSQHSGKAIPVTTVNGLAYTGKIHAVKFAGVLAFRLNGEKSVTAYLPVLTANAEKKTARNTEKEQKAQEKTLKSELMKLVSEALKTGKTVDVQALREQLGMGE